MNKIQIHHLYPQSRANGPGVRFVIFFQGCNLNCPNCINPRSHSLLDGQQMEIDSILQMIQFNLKSLDGITISGGEPFLQDQSLLELLTRIRELELSIIICTGYELDELEKMSLFNAICEKVDIILAGRYHHNERVASGLIGSANKTLIFCSDRYSERDIICNRKMEIQIKEKSLVLSGTDFARFFNIQQF